jgi:PAS domain S-box-containing protein
MIVEADNDGEVERAFAAVDWTRTPLGAPADWPAELTTMVRALLSSRFSMWMAWGPELTFFYNGAYARETLGRKHPWALGRPASEVWSEIWSEIGPRITSVIEDGVATWDERLLLFLERNGDREETYHTFSYSPLHDSDGQVGGMLCVVSEDTARVIAERRMETLRVLGGGLAAARTEPEMLAAVREHLTANQFDLPFSLVYLYDADGSARLSCAVGIEAGHPAAPELLEPANQHGAWSHPAAHEQLLVERLADVFDALPTGSWEDPPDRALVVPLGSQADDQTAGFLVAGLNPYQRMDANYSGFIDLLSGQIAAGIARARAYRHEQQRARALAELDRAKTEFFSNISHELRTPLTLIMAPVEDALQDREQPLPDLQRERLEMVRRNAARLRRMVSDILDFSRIERKGMGVTLTPTDLVAYTRGLVASFAPAIDRAGLELRESFAPLDRAVLVDVEMWEKIVLNLLSNALKFTLQGSISVSLKQCGGEIELEIADSGIGIAEEAVPRLFERFYRVSQNQGRSHEGSGIGLALVHELVTLHQGAITVTTAPGRGSSFVVRIPYGQAAGDAIQQMPSPLAGSYLDEALSWDADSLGEGVLVPMPRDASRSGATAGSILIADDNADLRAMLARMLEREYEVMTAGDGAQALELIRQRPPDLILSDVMMPRVDGLELLKALRDDPATASLPVIMLSAQAGEEAAIGGLEAGADDYLTKPFSARELVARVRSNLELAAVRREASAAIEVERQRLAGTLDQLPVGVIMIEAPSGRLVLANETVSRILGHPAIALQSLDEYAAYPSLTPDGTQRPAEDYALVQAVRDGRTTRDLDLRYRRGDGREIYIRVNAAPIRDQHGEIFAAVSVFQDVTSQVQSRQLLATHRDILARVAQGEPLSETLELLVQAIENSAEGTGARVSILLLSDDGRRLEHGAAPSLPADYNAAIDGITVGEAVGSCGTAAHRGAPVVVADTLSDPLWAAFRPLAVRYGLRACWSTPILAADGKVLGTVAVYHDQPWTPPDSEQQLVALMSQTAAVAIDRDRTARARAQQFAEMQRSLVPPVLPEVPDMEVATCFRPGTLGLEVGGDFYDLFALDDQAWGLMIGDVCGHGAEAAAATAVARHTARAVALREQDPAQVLLAVDDALRRSDLDRYCTAVYCRIEPSDDGFALMLANGGHPPPLVLRHDGTVEFARDHGSLLGILASPRPSPTTRISVSAGDGLLVYTDGLTERNPRLPREGRLIEAVAGLAGISAEQALERLAAELLGPGQAADDVAVVLLRASSARNG